MTATEGGRAETIEAPANPGDAHVLWLFTLTTFLSALLLFSVQPMFAKMSLPILGGAPSVWAVALCFFQAALLAGYGYAHWINRQVATSSAGYVHVGLYVLALVSLPIGVPRWFGEPPPGEPYLWQLAMYAVALGLPFVAVAANAPLLQAWFARSGHPQRTDPYFLYAASNLGSLVALLGYPFLLEPAFGVTTLSRLWAVGFVLLALALGACFWVIRDRPALSAPVGEADAGSAPPTAWDRAGWVGLALVPSGLLTAFTTHVSTDVASAPLIWVVPLALYLLTFVLVFRERPLISPRVMLALHLLAVVIALLQLSQNRHETAYIAAACGGAAFFTAAMVAHRTLYEARPAARHLTEFYLWMSFGGVLGGLFAALIAPRIFSEVFEYPLLLALTIACRPGAGRLFSLAATGVGHVLRRIGVQSAAGRPVLARADIDELLRLWLILATGLLLLLWVPWLVRRTGITTLGYGVTLWLTLLLAIAMLAFWRHPPRQLIAALMIFLAVSTLPSGVKRGDAQRSYFGVYRVAESHDGEFMILTHGTTLHGAQRIRDGEGNLVHDITPATYYHPTSPMARSVEVVRASLAGSGRSGRYGVVGLGAGSLACYAKPGETWRFYEIDPTVVGIARDPLKFSFLESCQPVPDIVIGDARLTLAREADESLDLLIVDAFSSDAVPVHLMTAEALRLYARKLTPRGVVILHISNRYLDLDAVVSATVAEVPELKGFIISDDSGDGTYGGSTSTVAALARDPAVLEGFVRDGWPRPIPFEAHGLRAWTDDYSDVLGPILRRWRAR